MFKRLKLGPKFTLILSLVFLGSSLLSYAVLSHFQRNTAQQTVTQQAIVLMDTLNSLRTNHVQEIRPLMDIQTDSTAEFIPETVPSYVVRQVFEQFRQQEEEFSKYLYKDATLNPTNPRDQADEFEAELVAQFKADANVEEIHGFRTLNDEPLFYVARPLAVTESSCLVCHSTPQAAPQNLISTYGSESGFGWNLHEIIATQIIYIPARQIFQAARKNTGLAVTTFMVIFALVLLTINRLLKYAVIEPLQPMAQVANYLSEESSPSASQSNETGENEFKKLDKIAEKTDELGQLARIFQRMARVVYSREQDLRNQFQNVLNEVQQKEDGSRETRIYLQKLLARSKEIRQRPTPDQK
ncbi:MAG: DUF3365 domain-containing protein [Cyanobacteria bacterium J06592_8]